MRLAQPARVCFERGHSVGSFAFVFDLFESLVGNLDAFLDAAEIRAEPERFDPRADKRTVKAYARLVGGWNRTEDAEERVARLVKALGRSSPLRLIEP